VGAKAPPEEVPGIFGPMKGAQHNDTMEKKGLRDWYLRHLSKYDVRGVKMAGPDIIAI
jgi:hypothetical protein